MSDAAEQIAERNRERHDHGETADRCKRCGAYVDKGEPENGVYRYVCWRCNGVLERA